MMSQKKKFEMNLILMWTINDFSMYEMVSRWETHRKLACLIV